jgi:hypothetical protein
MHVPSFLEIGGQNVCFFNLDDTPEKIARKILDFVGGLKPHRMFRKVMQSYVWDTIYREKLMPLLAGVIDTSKVSKASALHL